MQYIINSINHRNKALKHLIILLLSVFKLQNIVQEFPINFSEMILKLTLLLMMLILGANYDQY